MFGQAWNRVSVNAHTLRAAVNGPGLLKLVSVRSLLTTRDMSTVASRRTTVALQNSASYSTNGFRGRTNGTIIAVRTLLA